MSTDIEKAFIPNQLVTQIQQVVRRRAKVMQISLYFPGIHLCKPRLSLTQFIRPDILESSPQYDDDAKDTNIFLIKLSLASKPLASNVSLKSAVSPFIFSSWRRPIATNNRYHCVKSLQIRSFFWSVVSHIRTDYGEILRISPYSVRTQLAQKRFKNVASTLVFMSCESFWNVILGKFIWR